MNKTMIAVAVLSTMFAIPAYAREDVCAKDPTHPLCNPTPPVTPPVTPTPVTGPITVSPIIAPVTAPVIAPVIAPVTTVNPVIAPVTHINPVTVVAPTINNESNNANYNANSNANNNSNNNQNQNNNTAQGGAGGNGYGSAAASSSASGGAGGVGIGGSNSNSGNNTGTANVVVQGDAAQARDPVATAVAPTVVTGSDQCLVPVALGGQAVGFGLSFGVAVRDENCEVIKLSREVGQLAGKEAAVMMLRMHDKRVDEALKAVGK
jgi:hypothetical protein